VRRVEDITEALWGTRVSPSTVSDLNKKIYGTIETWRNRPIEGEHPYVVTLNDRRLECLRPKLRYPQLDLASLRLQLALVVAGPGIAACLAALVTLRIA
jgi:hypothetical protein